MPRTKKVTIEPKVETVLTVETKDAYIVNGLKTLEVLMNGKSYLAGSEIPYDKELEELGFIVKK
jgi:hypothetical protein